MNDRQQQAQTIRGASEVRMPITILKERPDSADAVQLIAELDAHLSRQSYPPESRHAFNVDQLVRDGVAFFIARYEGEPEECGGHKLFGSAHSQLERVDDRAA